MTEMSDELKGYADRLAGYDLGDYQGPTGDDADLRAGIVLARAYLAHIDEQQRIAAERALPIDAEWLKSIGFCENDGDECYFWVNGGHNARYDVQIWFRTGRICLSKPEGRFTIGNAKTTNCGNILDLLAALKIETKGT